MFGAATERASKAERTQRRMIGFLKGEHNDAPQASWHGQCITLWIVAAPKLPGNSERQARESTSASKNGSTYHDTRATTGALAKRGAAMSENKERAGTVSDGSSADRREFLHAAVAAGALALPPLAQGARHVSDTNRDGLPTRPLGKTDAQVSILCL